MAKAKRTTTTDLDDFCALLTEKVLALIDDDTNPFRLPWRVAQQGPDRNPATPTVYSGRNAAMLFFTRHALGWSPIWLSFNQAKALGLWLPKGAKSTKIVCPTPYLVDQKDEHGQPIRDEEGKPIQTTIPRFKARPIHNLSSFEDCEIKEQLLAQWCNLDHLGTPPDVMPEAEEVLSSWEVPVRWGSDGAAYSPSNDTILMPSRQQFRTAPGLYAAWAHEACHSTGHASRLNREGVAGCHPFRSPEYAQEELIAEAGAMLVGLQLGIGSEHDAEMDNHIAYLRNWSSLLRDKPQALADAFSDGQKAADLICPVPAKDAAPTETLAMAAA